MYFNFKLKELQQLIYFSRLVSYSYFIPFVSSFPIYFPYIYVRVYMYIFSFFCLRWVFVAARAFSSCGEQGLLCSWQCSGFSLQWLLLIHGTGSWRTGFSSCHTQAQ